MAENPRFAALCEAHGITFVGPPSHVMRLMRIAQQPADLALALNEVRAEALACFGDDQVYLDKLVTCGRHVEIQLMADVYGTVIHVGERDCTVQRNHQKLIEESPAPVLSPEERARTLAAACRAAANIGYVGAGTMEFLLDPEGTLRFMEMNTRLQVEHSVSEMQSGRDLVELQLRAAARAPLGLHQNDVALAGHTIECRINAEDPTDGFRPSPGRIQRWKSPVGDGVRVDTHVASGYEVPPFYDSLICKVLAHADDREAACDRMLSALDDLVCDGVATTVMMHQAILRPTTFRQGHYDTGAISGGSDRPTAVRFHGRGVLHESKRGAGPPAWSLARTSGGGLCGLG